MDSIVEAATGIPLFLFLDPCGAGLPFSDLARVLVGERRPKRPSTEVLLNFSADFTRRAAGALAAGHDSHESLPALDRVCGGDWWREVALQARGPNTTFEASAEAVARAYTDRLARRTGMRGVTVPVKRRVGHQPVYHLVFLTRSPFGIWVFADAIARARREWLEAMGPEEDDALFSYDGVMADVLAQEQEKARECVRKNLRNVVAHRNRVKLVDEVWSVFEGVYGLANDTTVRAALSLAAKDGAVSIIEQGNKIRDTVIGRGHQ